MRNGFAVIVNGSDLRICRRNDRHLRSSLQKSSFTKNLEARVEIEERFLGKYKCSRRVEDRRSDFAEVSFGVVGMSRD
jgi:hypothetical protein